MGKPFINHDLTAKENLTAQSRKLSHSTIGVDNEVERQRRKLI